MRIEGEVLQAPIPDPEAGDETPCAVALLVMNEGVTEAGLGTGWYWQRCGGMSDAELARAGSWEDAVRRGTGPYRSVEDAIAGAGRWTAETADLANLLQYGAELARCSDVGPGLIETARWLGAGFRHAAELRRQRGADAGEEPDAETEEAEDARIEAQLEEALKAAEAAAKEDPTTERTNAEKAEGERSETRPEPERASRANGRTTAPAAEQD